ncbi:unnamed protein product, partial [Polarella glacialis]
MALDPMSPGKGQKRAAAGNDCSSIHGNTSRTGVFVGVDLGGTTISVGLVDEQGSLISGNNNSNNNSNNNNSNNNNNDSNNSNNNNNDKNAGVQWESLGDDHDPKQLAVRVRRLVDAALSEAGRVMGDVVGCGVCTPGLLDHERGIVRVAANLRGWKEVPL